MINIKTTKISMEFAKVRLTDFDDKSNEIVLDKKELRELRLDILTQMENMKDIITQLEEYGKDINEDK